MINTALKNSIKRKWKSYLALVFLTVLIVIAELLPPKMLEYFINDVLTSASTVTKEIIAIIALYVSALFLSGIFDFLKQMLLIHLGADFTTEIRRMMAEKLKRVKSSVLISKESGELASRFESDVDQINTLFSDGAISMAIDLFKIIAILVAMFLYSVYLGFFVLIFIPIILAISMFFKKCMFRSQVKSRRMIGCVNNHISETFRNERMIKIYDKEDYMIGKNQEYLEENYKASVRVSFFDGLYSPVIQILTAIVVSLLVLTTNMESLSIGLSIGALAGAIEYVTELFAPVESLGMELQQIQKASSGLYRVREFLNLEEDPVKSDVSLDELLSHETSFTFQDVTFSYEEGRNVLEHISFSVEKNAKVSFVGRTGVGKTTLFRLITGEMAPKEGRVLFNGHDTSSIPDEYRHKLFGYVSQEFKPMTGESIRDNITMKNKDITDEMVLKALRDVSMKEKILSLEEGLDAVMKPSMFSQGELELLNIARAIVSEPKILLLDEMTSNLDSLTEERILQALSHAKEERMILQISHRLSTTLDSDYVISLENGRLKSMEATEEFRKHSWIPSSFRLQNLKD